MRREVLSTTCSEDRGAWTLDVRGRADALIRVTNQNVIMHEMQHVVDLREGANALAARASATSFASKESCEGAALSFREHFRSTLQTIARESNRMRR